MTYGKSENVKINHVNVVHETNGAYLVRFVDGNKVWLPKSQCELDGQGVEMPEWLAVEKGIENYVD